MTADEFKAVPALLLDGGWPGDLDQGAEKAYYIFLSDFTAEQVTAAIKALRSSPFRPTPGEIANAITPPNTVGFEEIMRLVETYNYGRGDKQEFLDRIESRCAAAFIARHAGRFHGVPMIGEDGKWNRKDLQQTWKEYSENWAGREVASLAAGRGRGELGHLDPLAALEASRPALGVGDE